MRTISVLLIILLFWSCGHVGPSEITKEIDGTYLFKYSSGQIEVLKISTVGDEYSQTFYQDERQMKLGQTLYTNKGTWTRSGTELGFDNWLSICDMGRDIDSILPDPEHYTMTHVSWYAPRDNHKGLIIFYEDNNYILTKIE